MANRQALLIDDCSDLALFSGTPVVGHVREFQPKPANRQIGMFKCALCRDNGLVKIGARWVSCVCKKGQL